MMYCDRCNIDFSEGLRYCKWCGQTLVERNRVTSEFQSCPTCEASIKPSWVFCKSCGARLTGQETSEPTHIATSETASTSLIAKCSMCGEKVDTGSVYCKGCGAALYDQQTPFGSSALLCSLCHSYSPVGSTTCRVCGALLIETAASLANDESETVVIKPKESSTLPDLGEHLPVTENDERTVQTAERVSQFGDDEIQSGAHTLTLSQAETKRSGAQDPTSPAPRPRGGETSVLPGVAGSKFEQPLPTTTLQMDRTTGPVDSEEPEDAEPVADSGHTPPIHSAPVTLVDTAGFNSLQAEAANQSTVQFISEADLNSPSKDEGTIAFGSSADSSAAFQSEDQTSTVRFGEETASREQIRTEQFAAASPPPTGTNSHGSIESQRLDAPANWTETFNKPAVESVKRTERNLAAAHTDSPTAVAEPAVEEKKSNATFITAIAVIIVLAVSGFAVWWFMWGGKPVETPKQPVAEEKPAEPAPPDKPPAPVVPEGMVTIPAGAYTIGRDAGSELERPQHTVQLPAFLIDRTEVTNADYKKFVDATAHKPPVNWKDGAYDADRASYPVTGVTWQDAVDYAQWAGKRLPTEAEWEAAARGSEGRRYPWGNEWRASFANIGGASGGRSNDKDYPAQIKPVGQYPDGASQAGVLDLIGNVWEFTADKFDLYPNNPKRLSEIRIGPNKLEIKLDPNKTYRIIRGGAFDGSEEHDASYRGLVDASQPFPKTGFRCVKDIK
jgi:formylglycine-generating enzyme required for sulfatase activity